MKEFIRPEITQMKPSQWLNTLNDWWVIESTDFSGGVSVPKVVLFTLPENKERVENEFVKLVPARVAFEVKYVSKQELNDIRSMT